MQFIRTLLYSVIAIVGLGAADARASEIELDGGLATAAGTDSNYARSPAGYVASATLGGRGSAADFGVQYEELRFTARAPFASGTLQVGSLVVRKLFWIGGVFLGPTFEAGLFDVERLRGDPGRAVAASTFIYAYGLRLGYRLGNVGLGAELLRREARFSEFPSGQTSLADPPDWSGLVGRYYLSYWF